MSEYANPDARPMWQSESNRKQAEAHWSTVPDYPVAGGGDRKVDGHPLRGVAMYRPN